MTPEVVESPGRLPQDEVVSVFLVAIDFLGVASSFLIAFYLRLWIGDKGLFFDPLQPDLAFFLSYWPVILLWPLVFWLEGMYPGSWKTLDQQLRGLLRGVTLASLIVISLTFLTQTGPQFSRPILVAWWLIMLVILPINHFGLRSLLPGLGVRGSPAVILGTSAEARLVLESLEKRAFPVVRPVAAFAGPGEPAQGLLGRIPIVGGVEQLAGWAAANGAAVAIVVQPELPQSRLVDLIDRLSTNFRRVLVVPNLRGLSTAETDVRDIEGVLALEVRRNLLVRRSQIAKMLLELSLGMLVGVLSLPLVAFIVLALLLERQGSVIYGHRRIGRRGQPFTAWKFRTMVKDADQVLERAISSDPALRVEWEQAHKLRLDPRLTAVGRVLRRLSLDELPQLWNVLRLEMSLVGPRPIVREEIPRYGQAFELYTQVRPGLTGLWQVSGRSNLIYDERVRLDAYYVRNWSVWLDLVILIRTLVVVVTGRGAY